MVSAFSLSIFRHLFASVAEEMGVTLERTAYSPNIKERLDFSCALFLGDGQMLAQAAHIPVHLGAMPASVAAAITQCSPFSPGDVIILNDPYQGGNHLPDITLVSPIFLDNEIYSPQFFVASRAHHADVGGISPGSMPLSTELYQEGVIIPPIKLVDAGIRNEAVWRLILRNVRTPIEREGDLTAQMAAHATGSKRLGEIVAKYGLESAQTHANDLIAYAERLTRAAIAQIPDGTYSFCDYLDDDGQSDDPIPIQATISIENDQMVVDFAGTATAVAGNLNATPAIAQSAVAYCVRCAALQLTQTDLPMNQGAFAPVKVIIESGSLLDPHPPHAVAAGNVETSQRVVDVIFGALALALPYLIPAASQGTMNNFTFGGVMPDGKMLDEKTLDEKMTDEKMLAEDNLPPVPFAYYETIGGGVGANAEQDGGDGMHIHMSNTLNTPIEALEYSFPIQVMQYSLRLGSGGAGARRGGDGLIRAVKFKQSVTAAIVSERRQRGAYGLQGGEAGKPGHNILISDGERRQLPGKITLALQAGDVLQIETPGGGGWGVPPE